MNKLITFLILGENISLARESQNPQDNTAMHVDSMHSVRLEYAKAAIAKVISPIIDNSSPSKHVGNAKDKMFASILRLDNRFEIPSEIICIAHARS